jgi:hypothetical protein
MNPQFDLNVRTQTWNHDSRGLFDYESKNVFKRSYRAKPTTETYTVNRNGSEVAMTMTNAPAQNFPSFFQSTTQVDGSLSPLRIPSDMDSRADSKPLVRVFFEYGQYWVDHPDRTKDASRTLWQVIRQSKYPTPINSGDMLKMGRYKIRVKEAVTEVQSLPGKAGKRFSIASTDSYDGEDATCCSKDDGTLSSIEQTVPESHSCDSSGRRSSHPLVDIQTNEVCRICYDSGETENPLIAPCKCSGSMQYVHLQCLRKWMDGRLSVNTNTQDQGTTTVSYFWRNLDCELCKLSYPTTVECPSKRIPGSVELVDLYELPKPEPPYVILESNIKVPVSANSSTGSTSGYTFQKGLHIMSLSKGRSSVVVGRGHEADVRINDISVSRFHGVIRFLQSTSGNGARKSQIVIEDRGSKFGSLIAVKGPIPLDLGVPVSIQSGRTITTITVKKPNLFSNLLCFRPGGAGASQPASAALAAHPVLLSESGPVIDLKQVLNNPAPIPEQNGDQFGRERRQLMARASVASTALRRASEALSMIQFEEEDSGDRQQVYETLSPNN